MTPHDDLRWLRERAEEIRPLIKERRGMWDIPGMHGAAVALLALIDAQRAVLREFSESAQKVLDGFDSGDVRGDAASDWAIRHFPFLRALAVLQDAIEQARALVGEEDS